MAASDPFALYSLDPFLGNGFVATVVHDTSELATVARFVVCETTGDICLVDRAGTSAIYTVMIAGYEIRGHFKQIKATGTTIASSAVVLQS